MLGTDTDPDRSGSTTAPTLDVPDSTHLKQTKLQRNALTRCGTGVNWCRKKYWTRKERRGSHPTNTVIKTATTTTTSTKCPVLLVLACAALKVKVKHHKRHLTWHTSNYGPEMERNWGGGWRREEGGGALTSCIWALKSAHEDNWKDCIITWATACGGEHTAHSPWSVSDNTQQADQPPHTHTYKHTLKHNTPSIPSCATSYSAIEGGVGKFEAYGAILTKC